MVRVQRRRQAATSSVPAGRSPGGTGCNGRLAASHWGQSMVMRMLTLDSADPAPALAPAQFSRTRDDDRMDGARVPSSAASAECSRSRWAALSGAASRAPRPHMPTRCSTRSGPRYARVRTEIRHLDNHAEMLTEQYDRVVWQLGVLASGEDRHPTARSSSGPSSSRAGDPGPAHRRAVQGRRPAHDRHRARGIVACPGDRQHGSEAAPGYGRRRDRAAIDAAKQAIVVERRAIAAAQVRERADKRQIIIRRREIRRELRKRHRLVGVLGRQITVMTAADRIGQADLALQAQKWLTADLKADAADPGQELRDQIALEALQQIGVPYVWGGATPRASTAPGLVMWLWANHGVALPHFAASQYHMGPLITRAQLRPGDLVFFHDLGHVAIYIGNGWVVHAPHTGDCVRMERFSLPWFQATYVGATQPGPA